MARPGSKLAGETEARFVIAWARNSKSDDLQKPRERMKEAFARMKTRWGVGPFGVVAILVAFAAAGSSVLYVGHPIKEFLLPENAAGWLRVVVYILVIFPLYHVLLLGYAALLGQFRFFWRREKQMLWHLRRLVLRRPAP